MPSDNKFSILIIAARYPGYGGIERVTTQLANHWAQSSNVVIASLRQQDEALLEQLSPNVKFIKFPYGGLKYSKDNIIFLEKLIVEEKVNILIYQDSYFPCQYLLNNIRQNGLKIIQVEHSCPNGFEKEYEQTKTMSAIKRFKGWINLRKSKKSELNNRKLIYNACDRFVMLSKEYIPICKRLGKISEDYKFRVIGNPVSLTPAEFDLNDKANECVFVGRLDPVKGIDRLLRIWSKVESIVPDWNLTIVGDGIEMPMVQNLIRTLNLKGVTLDGYQKQVDKYYRRAKIYCMCSTYEGFPMVLPEAMAYGVVPIAFDSFASYRTIVTDGESGVSVTPFDEDKYAMELISLMQDRTKLNRMQIACMKKAEDFTPDVIFALWDNLFNELMENK